MKTKFAFVASGLLLALVFSQSTQSAPLSGFFDRSKSGPLSGFFDRGKNPRDCMQGLSDKGEALSACLKAERESNGRDFAKCINELPEADQTNYRNCMDQKNKSLLK